MPSAVWGRGLPNLLPAPSKTPAPAKCQGPPQPTPTLEPSRSLATLPSKGRSLLLVLTQSPPAQSGPGLSFPRWYTGGTRALAGLTLCHLACACLLTWGERGLPRTLKTGVGHCPLQPGARYHPVFLPQPSAAAHRSPEGLIWTVGSAQAVLWGTSPHSGSIWRWEGPSAWTQPRRTGWWPQPLGATGWRGLGLDLCSYLQHTTGGRAGAETGLP